jgi:phosphatidylserine decarboxylase
MTLRSALACIAAREDLNFLLTNRLPRRLATTLVGRFSKIEHPVVARLSIAVWKLFSDVDLRDARDTHFKSMHACFTRALRDGARPAVPDPSLLASPCDAIVGASGRVDGDVVLQIKGSPYSLSELIGDPGLAASFRDGRYVTLRLTAGMYHRFHAPHDLTVEEVRYISGDTWNVNPIALRRVERLFCRNERAVICARTEAGGWPILLVPVAAILVAGIRLRFLDTEKLLREGGPRRIACDVPLRKGEEMGWFEHGSTIIVFVPVGFELAEDIVEGQRIRAGEALLRLPVI